MYFTKLPSGQIFVQKDFINAKPQLVISKNVCDSFALNMTLYSFGAAEGITWQYIPGDLLLTVIEGDAFLEVADKEISDKDLSLGQNLKSHVKGMIAKKGMGLVIKGGDRFQISGNGKNPYKLNFSIINKNIGGTEMFIKNFEQGKVVTLKNQISFEEGTIISKTLVNRDDLTMTIFAFDKDQSVATHSAAGDAFVVCLEGKAEITLNGEKLSITEGQSLIMPAGAPHALKAIKPYKMLLSVVKA